MAAGAPTCFQLRGTEPAACEPSDALPMVSSPRSRLSRSGAAPVAPPEPPIFSSLRLKGAAIGRQRRLARQRRAGQAGWMDARRLLGSSLRRWLSAQREPPHRRHAPAAAPRQQPRRNGYHATAAYRQHTHDCKHRPTRVTRSACCPPPSRGWRVAAGEPTAPAAC